MRILQGFFLLAGLSLLAGCATTVQNSVHHSYSKQAEAESEISEVQPGARKILLMPADIRISELGIASAEEVPEWSAKGTELVNKKLQSYFQDNLRHVEIIFPADFSKQEEQAIEQHLALYDLVAGNSLGIRNIDAFKSEMEKPDDTLGSGLRFLKEKTGADQVLLVSGQDFVSSSERVATMVMAAALGVAVAGGQAYLNTGLIDMETGDVIWTNTALSGTATLKEESGARDLVKQTLTQFPTL